MRPRPFCFALGTLALVFVLGARAHAGDPAPKDEPGSLVLDKQVQDWGVVDQDREYSAEIGYRNAGTRPITDLRVKADCGCYSVALSDADVAPGATGTLTVRFRTHGFRGRASKMVRLLYTDDAPRAAALKLALNIVGGVLAERMHFGEVLAGTKPEGSVKLLWYEGVGQPFDIARIEIPGEPIETRVERWVPKANYRGDVDAVPPPPPQFKGWVIHFAFTQPPPRGIYSKKAIVTTTHPTQKRVLIPLTASVVGKVWVQTSRVYLGLIPQGQTKSAGVTFRPFKPEFKLGAVSARARKGVLQVAIEDGVGPTGPVKKLVVTVPADAAPGSLDDVIELRTEVPGEELVTVEVRGRVFVPAGR